MKSVSLNSYESEELREHMILPTDVIFFFGSFWEWTI